MSADLEKARLITDRSAWASDTEGPTSETTAAPYRAKYMVGEVVSSIPAQCGCGSLWANGTEITRVRERCRRILPTDTRMV
jgi:hypothetical protein